MKKTTYKIDVQHRHPHKCGKCGRQSFVVDSRNSNKGYRRRRECENCKHRWTTYEFHSDVVRDISEQVRDKIMQTLNKVDIYGV